MWWHAVEYDGMRWNVMECIAMWWNAIEKLQKEGVPKGRQGFRQCSCNALHAEI